MTLVDESEPTETSEVAPVLPDLDPSASRKANVAGEPFILADGQVWFLASPALRIRPRFVKANPADPDSREVVELDYRVGYPVHVERIVDQFRAKLKADQQDQPLPFAEIIGAAIALLRLAHVLGIEDATALCECGQTEAIDLAVGMLRMFRGERIQNSPEEPDDTELPSESD